MTRDHTTPSFLVPFLSFALAVSACDSNDSTGDMEDKGTPGGPVEGALDTHCGTTIQATSQDACLPDDGAGGLAEGTYRHSGGAEDHEEEGGAAGEADDEYGATLFNAEGDDDECKYHVSFTSTAVHKDEPVYFTLNVTAKADSAKTTGAKPSAEVFLDSTHPAPNSDSTSEEIEPGVYKLGPILFDAAGQWTVRFHFFEGCVDGEESPHGHIAFYVEVP